MNAPKRIQTMTLWILRYDKAEWSSLITLLFARLFVLVSGTHCFGPLPRSLVHLPVLMGECHISAVMQRPTNRLRWERLGSMVGTLLPSFLSLPGNRCRLREGPPAACCLNKGQTKTLATRQVTRVNVVFSVIHPPPPSSLLFLLMAAHHFTFWQGWKKRIYRATEKNKQPSVGTVPSFFFLLPGAFISINSAYTGICAPVAPDQGINFFIVCKNKHYELYLSPAVWQKIRQTV